MQENRKVYDLLLLLSPQAVSKTKSLAERNVANFEFLRGLADVQRHRAVLNQARQHLVVNVL